MGWQGLAECLVDPAPGWVRSEFDRLIPQAQPVVWQPEAGQDLSLLLYDMGRSPLPLRVYPEGLLNAVFLMSDNSAFWEFRPRVGFQDCTAEHGRLQASISIERVWSTALKTKRVEVPVSFCDVSIAGQYFGLPSRRCFLIYARNYTEAVYSILFDFQISIAAVVLVSQPHQMSERREFRTREHLLGQLRRDESVIGPVEYCLHDRTGDTKAEVGVTADEDSESPGLAEIAEMGPTDDSDVFEHIPVDEIVLRRSGYLPTKLARHGWGKGGVRLWRKVL